MIRVIAGRFRSRKLMTLPGVRTRPTTDQLRETLFNILGPRVEGCIFCDLYAGSGAVGIEALSRGAEKAYFVEGNPRATQITCDNLKTLGVEYETETEVFGLAVTRALKKFANQELRFDIVFLDPPYDAGDEYTRTLQWLGSGELLRPEALVIAEHSKRHTLANRYGALELQRSVTHGDATLSLFSIPV